MQFFMILGVQCQGFLLLRLISRVIFIFAFEQGGDLVCVFSVGSIPSVVVFFCFGLLRSSAFQFFLVQLDRCISLNLTCISSVFLFYINEMDFLVFLHILLSV